MKKLSGLFLCMALQARNAQLDIAFAAVNNYVDVVKNTLLRAQKPKPAISSTNPQAGLKPTGRLSGSGELQTQGPAVSTPVTTQDRLAQQLAGVIKEQSGPVAQEESEQDWNTPSPYQKRCVRARPCQQRRCLVHG